jgi:hypothetical protein
MAARSNMIALAIKIKCVRDPLLSMCVQLASAVQVHAVQQLGLNALPTSNLMLPQRLVQTLTHVLAACQAKSRAWPVGLRQTPWHQGHPGSGHTPLPRVKSDEGHVEHLVTTIGY